MRNVEEPNLSVWFVGTEESLPARRLTDGEAGPARTCAQPCARKRSACLAASAPSVEP